MVLHRLEGDGLSPNRSATPLSRLRSSRPLNGLLELRCKDGARSFASFPQDKAVRHGAVAGARAHAP
jgi:hypothetical protein